MISEIYFKFRKHLIRFETDNKGVASVEVILILVVLIGLVIIVVELIVEPFEFVIIFQKTFLKNWIFLNQNTLPPEFDNNLSTSIL